MPETPVRFLGGEDPLEKGKATHSTSLRFPWGSAGKESAFQKKKKKKNLPAMQETWVRPLGWEDPPEKGKATHSSILAWRIPWIV